MATDERLTYLEARVDEHSEAIRELRDDIRRLDQKCDLRFDAIDRRFDAVDRRFETMDTRFDRLNDKIDALRTEVARDRRTDLRWMVGLHITTIIAVVSAVLTGILSR